MKPVRLACLLTLVSTIMLAQTNPVPLINNPLVPDAAAPGGQTFTLTVNGTGFVSSSVVNWNGAALTTTFVSGSQLTATVPAANIAAAGTASVTVVNPAPAGASNVEFFDVRLPFAAVSFGESTVNTGITSLVTVADLNGDGKQDLAVTSAEFDSTSISISLGNGDGTFQPPVSYTVPEGPGIIVAADFNGDGKLDLALSSVTGYVSVLIGNGDGTFQPAENVNLGLELAGLAAGDFNGDGNQDLAVAVYYPTAQVAILLGNGNGTFQNAAFYTAGSRDGQLLTVGDFNGDGHLDVAMAVQYDNAVAILLGNGDGSLQGAIEYTTTFAPIGVVTGDFNGDGKLDLAVASGDVSVLLGNGDGTFQGQVLYPRAGMIIAAADINGDGNLDLVSPFFGSGQGTGTPSVLATYLGKGDGTFAHANYFPTGVDPVGVAVADFNGDGLPDVTTANANTSNGSTLLQVTAVLSETSVIFPPTTVGSSSTAKVTFSNKGNAAITINKIALNKQGTPFTENNNCGTGLQPHASCTITIVFAPTTKNKYVGTAVEIKDSAVSVLQTIYLEGLSVSN